MTRSLHLYLRANQRQTWSQV